jgi:single-stranded DNA-binding protein
MYHNKFTIVGTVANQPRIFKDGTCTIMIVGNKKWTDTKGNKKDLKEINFVIYEGKKAEDLCSQVKVGQLITMSGRSIFKGKNRGTVMHGEEYQL